MSNQIQRLKKYRYPTLDERAAMIDYIRIACKKKTTLNNKMLHSMYRVYYAIDKLKVAGYLKEAGAELYEFTDYNTPARDIAFLVWKRSGINIADLQAATDLATSSIHPVVSINAIEVDQVQYALDMIGKYKITDAAQYIADHLNNIKK